VEGFRTLDASASKTFIYTGNALNVMSIPGLMTFAMHKSATAAAIRTLATTGGYDKEGIS
jgi:hypothetical protein